MYYRFCWWSVYERASATRAMCTALKHNSPLNNIHVLSFLFWYWRGVCGFFGWLFNKYRFNALCTGNCTVYLSIFFEFHTSFVLFSRLQCCSDSTTWTNFRQHELIFVLQMWFVGSKLILDAINTMCVRKRKRTCDMRPIFEKSWNKLSIRAKTDSEIRLHKLQTNHVMRWCGDSDSTNKSSRIAAVASVEKGFKICIIWPIYVSAHLIARTRKDPFWQ